MTATKTRPTRSSGWLTERVLRSGLSEQWAYRRGGDRLYVTLHADGDQYCVRSVVMPAEGGYHERTTWHLDIGEARNAFTNLTKRLTMGDYPIA